MSTDLKYLALIRKLQSLCCWGTLVKTKNSIAGCNPDIKSGFKYILFGARERRRSFWVLEENLY